MTINYAILNDLIGYQLGRAYLRSHAKYLKIIAKHGLASGHFSILTLINNNLSLSQTALAKASGLDRSSITLIANQLIKLKYIEKKQGINARTNVLVITEEGKSALKSIEKSVLKHEYEILSELTDTEKEQLLSLLKKIALDENLF